MSKTTVEIRYSEREIIAIRIRMKWSYSRIGWFLGRDHSVIRREIIRNRTRSGIYDAMYAQKVADSRKKKTNRAKIDTHPYLQKYIIERIRDDRLSPEQVAGRLRVAPPPELVGVTISHESIYLWIYNHARWLCQYLKRKIYTRRQKRYSRKKQYRYPLTERISIHQRPQIISLKERYGDWESDSMKFSKQKTALSVQYERKSMLVRIHKVANLGKDETYQAISKSIDSLPQYFFKSITFDNGGEAARHTQLRDIYGILTFFCDSYKSWQKGGVENINGLIRQYLPKKTNLDTMFLIN